MRVKREVAKSRHKPRSASPQEDEDGDGDESDGAVKTVEPPSTIHSNRRYLDDYKVPEKRALVNEEAGDSVERKVSKIPKSSENAVLHEPTAGKYPSSVSSIESKA